MVRVMFALHGSQSSLGRETTTNTFLVCIPGTSDGGSSAEPRRELCRLIKAYRGLLASPCKVGIKLGQGSSSK